MAIYSNDDLLSMEPTASLYNACVEKLTPGCKQVEVRYKHLAHAIFILYAKKISGSDQVVAGRAVWGGRYMNPVTKTKNVTIYGDARKMPFHEVVLKDNVTAQKIGNGIDPNSASMTVDRFFNEIYIVKAKVTKKSWRDDQYRYQKYIKGVIGEVELGNVTRQMLQCITDQLPEAFAAGSVYQIEALKKGIFTCAEKMEFIDRSPARHIKLVRPANECKRVLSDDEYKAQLIALDAGPERLKLLVLLLLATGCRVGELLSARHDDVEGEILHLPKTKSNRPQTVNLSSMAMPLIARLSEIRTNEYLFAGRFGGHLTRPGKAMMKMTKAAGLEGVSFHTARRTFATRASAAGVGLLDLKAMLRHQTTAMTARYVVQSDEHMRRQCEKVSEVFLSIATQEMEA